MLFVSKVILGFICDLFCGDPYSVTHPVQVIGYFIRLLEKMLRRFFSDRIAGGILVLCIVGSTYLGALGFSALSWIFELFLIYAIFAVHSLVKEANAVYQFLQEGDIREARKRLSFLVSRDTDTLDAQGILQATLETVAENIVDGIISPMFFLFLGGAPLAMAFKAVSTLDSMVGYKNERYISFGWASARLDDLCNFIPARLTAFIFLPVAACIHGYSIKNTFVTVLRDRKKHSSPNAGHAEAAVAGALGIRLGGPSYYFGRKVKKPYIGKALRKGDIRMIHETIKMTYTASIAGLFVMSTLYLFFIRFMG